MKRIELETESLDGTFVAKRRHIHQQQQEKLSNNKRPAAEVPEALANSLKRRCQVILSDTIEQPERPIPISFHTEEPACHCTEGLFELVDGVLDENPFALERQQHDFNLYDSTRPDPTGRELIIYQDPMLPLRHPTISVDDHCHCNEMDD